MSRALLLLFCALVLLSEPGRSESTATGMCEILRASGHRWTITWTVPNAVVMDAKSWDQRKGPPLSLEQATAIARSYLRRQGARADLPVCYSELIHPPLVDSRIPFYFYFIDFDDFRQSEPPQHVLQVVVLLDGSVVPPKLTIEPKMQSGPSEALHSPREPFRS